MERRRQNRRSECRSYCEEGQDDSQLSSWGCVMGSHTYQQSVDHLMEQSSAEVGLDEVWDTRRHLPVTWGTSGKEG